MKIFSCALRAEAEDFMETWQNGEYAFFTFDNDLQFGVKLESVVHFSKVYVQVENLQSKFITCTYVVCTQSTIIYF
jgi:hypothetical protein